MAEETDGLVRFHRLIACGLPPQRADRAAGGLLPTRAFRYCEAVTSAAAFGWYAFPPIGFTVTWNGEQLAWTFDGADEWFPLGRAQFPGYADAFDQDAPEAFRGYSPPFLVGLPEPGMFQVWSGLIARTAPGYSLLVRAPANLPRQSSHEMFEGVIETDRWFGPLFTNIRLTRTDIPVSFAPDYPLFQIQPLPRSLYLDERLNRFDCLDGVASFEPSDWADYRATVMKGGDPERPVGHQASEVRRRRRADVEPS